MKHEDLKKLVVETHPNKDSEWCCRITTSLKKYLDNYFEEYPVTRSLYEQQVLYYSKNGVEDRTDRVWVNPNIVKAQIGAIARSVEPFLGPLDPRELEEI